MYLHFYLNDDLILAIRFLLWFTICFGLLVVSGLSAFFCFKFREDYLTKVVQRKILEKDAHLHTVSNSGQIVVIQNRDGPTWDQNHYVIKSKPDEPVTALIEPSKLDLLKVFTQALQCYAIIGGQQTGKTFQGIQIANYWLSHNIQPWVIGPKWDVGEWAGCKMFGGKGDFEAVEDGIKAVTLEVSKRHADDRSHKDHLVLPIFFDDWTPIVGAVPKARQLILEATTLYASVNIILYFLIHSDTAEAWGVGRKGAALKDNFIKLIIHPYYDNDGIVVIEKTTASIKFPGVKDLKSVDLLKKIYQTIPEPDDLFKSLVESGISRREASKKAYGKPYSGITVTRGKSALGEL